MDHNDRVRHCEDVARTLRQILDRGSVPLTTEEEFRFQEYLDANELGLAFDLLRWKIEDTAVAISPQVYDLIADAGSKMEYPPNTWEKLKRSIR